MTEEQYKQDDKGWKAWKDGLAKGFALGISIASLIVNLTVGILFLVATTR